MPDPLIVSRFDVAIEPAPEEDQVLTIGCIAEDGRPVALLLDKETRDKVAGWLTPSHADRTGTPNPRLDIAEALEADGWIGDAVDPPVEGAS